MSNNLIYFRFPRQSTKFTK